MGNLTFFEKVVVVDGASGVTTAVDHHTGNNARGIKLKGTMLQGTMFKGTML
jgi:hypothetical protein